MTPSMSTRRRVGTSRHSLFMIGIMLATSMALVASEDSSAPNKIAAADGEALPTSNKVKGKRVPVTRILPNRKTKVTRILPKNPEPTYFPTEEPKQQKPKKTDPPTYPPTISPNDDIRDTPAPVIATMKPTKSPTDEPTLSPTFSPTDAPSISLQPTVFPSSIPTISQMPSVSPTGMPSSMPSSQPTGIPSGSPTTSTMPSMAPIPYSRAPRIDLRYQPWTSLTPEQQTLATQLDYTEQTWSVLDTNPVESLNWQRLPREQKNAARSLGFDQYSWDCWQNHFQSYRWIDLNLPYIQVGQWWETLGWDIYAWNQISEQPPANELNWYELPADLRDAAAQLCYFRTSWDEDNVLVDGLFTMERPAFRYVHWMDLEKGMRGVADVSLKYSALTWNVLGLDAIEGRGWTELTLFESEAATSVGFDQLSWDCWQNHFKSYTWYDLTFYGLDFPYMALGWTELSWDGMEAPPPTASMSWKELSPDERKVAAEVCYFRDNWDGLDMTPNNSPFLYPRVKQRYVEWDTLSADVRAMARASLIYTKQTWNELGTAEIEKRSWEQLTGEQKSNAISLGFYQRTWDCFQNHYRSYEWENLDRDSRNALQVLGWSETSWKENAEPTSYENGWERLSGSEQDVASYLCFFEDNWDGNSLEVIAEKLAAQEEAAAQEAAANEGGGTGGTEGSTTIADSGAQTPADAGEGGAELASGTSSNPVELANSARVMGARSVTCIVTIALGTLIQYGL